ncbi:hypothetical protein JW823_07190 [bacterium]|nr:hypothetical protein [candidate division CSSED10-310 bacterium]
MKKNTALKILNPVMGLLVINQAITGMLSESIPHEAFEILHEGGGPVLVAAVALHVFLNWNWIRATYLKKGQGQGQG